MPGLIATKRGMSRSLDPNTGQMVPVTLLEVADNQVVQLKSAEKDGVTAAVVAQGTRKPTKRSAAKNTGGRFRNRCQFSAENWEVKVGDQPNINLLEGIERLKVTAKTKGRGFSGVIRRHNFSRGPETHGSGHHREPGSVGNCAKPGRIQKGRAMPGRYGHTQQTHWGTVVQLCAEDSLVAIKGGIPGAVNSPVYLSWNN